MACRPPIKARLLQKNHHGRMHLADSSRRATGASVSRGGSPKLPELPKQPEYYAFASAKDRERTQVRRASRAPRLRAGPFPVSIVVCGDRPTVRKLHSVQSNVPAHVIAIRSAFGPGPMDGDHRLTCDQVRRINYHTYAHPP